MNNIIQRFRKVRPVKSSLRSRWLSRIKRGQGLVEFALALPILLFIILGFIEAARWFQAYLSVQYAARETARYAVSGQPPMMEEDGENSCEEIGHPDNPADPYDLPDEYIECRIDWIKHVGLQVAGLALPNDPNQDNIQKAGYLGVLVRGSPTFGSVPVADHPGAARTKIEITIVYNHQVTNPFFAAMLPTIRVVGRIQMVNEPWEGGGADPPPVVPTATPLPPLDTDGDGWSDVEERDIYETFLSNPDTDGDGYDEGPSGQDNTSERALDPCYPDASDCH